MMKISCKGKALRPILASTTLILLFTSTPSLANCDELQRMGAAYANTMTICNDEVDVLLGYSTHYKSPVWGVYKMKASLSAQEPIYVQNTGAYTPVQGLSNAKQVSYKQIINSGLAKADLVPHYNVLDKSSQVPKFLTMANVYPVDKEGWFNGLSDLMFELGVNERKMALQKGDFTVVSGVVYDADFVNEVPSAKYLYKVYYHDQYDYTLSYLIPVQAKSPVLSSYLTSVHCIEEISGHTLFSGFDRETKDSIENGVAYSSEHWVSPNQMPGTCS